jgi:menaquinone-dependent protoporphyrinogen IX oxidase
MKTAVVYKSKTGSTKEYAQWIAEELKADLFKLSDFDKSKIGDYEIFIYGGGLYAVGINGIKFIKNNWDKFKNKKLIVFATGASPKRKEVIEDITNNNFNKEEKEKIKFFYLRGGFNFEKLGFLDKFLIKKLEKNIKKKKNPNPDERGMLKAIKEPVSFRKKENIDELITYIKNE